MQIIEFLNNDKYKNKDPNYNSMFFTISNIYSSFKKDMGSLFDTPSKVYWKIGKEILNMQAKCAWGEKIIYQLADDLYHEFNENIFTFNNLKSMRKFAHLFREEKIENPLFYVEWSDAVNILNNIKNKNMRKMLNVRNNNFV